MLHTMLRQNVHFVGYSYDSGCQKYSLLWGPARAKVRSRTSILSRKPRLKTRPVV